MDTLIVLTANWLFIPICLGAGIFGLLLRPEHRREFFLWGCIGGLIAFGLTKLAGLLYFDPRPFTHGVKALISHAPDNGFPSDHSVLTFTAALIVMRFNKPVGIVLLLGASLVGVSRVAAGIHSPIDITAGIFIAAAAAALGLPLALVLAKRWVA